MPYLVYDSETSGLPLYGERSFDPRQPHLVELAAILYDDQHTELERMSRIVKPDGWVMSDEVVAVHHITNERAHDEGLPRRQVLEEFRAMYAQAQLRVAHFESFDARIIRIAYFREYGEVEADLWKNQPAYDTCAQSRRVFKGEKAGIGEVYKRLFGEAIEDAHRALNDALACARVYREFQLNPALAR